MVMKPNFRTATSLAGQFLVALPTMPDPRFARALIYIISHTPEGTMGIQVNRLQSNMSFTDLLLQLDIPVSEITPDMPVLHGGPVESGRGFVLHSDDFSRDGTTPLGEGLAMTATVDILRAMAEGKGPAKTLLALGYAGWQGGQLETELQGNGWLTAPATADVLFDPNLEAKWDRAIGLLGITPAALSVVTGHA